jgi:Xaa-Pro aminopeptidase
VVVAENAGALFLDGRYTVAAKKYVDPSKFKIFPHEFFPMVDWICQNIPPDVAIGYDPRFYSHAEYKKLQEALPLHQWTALDLRKTLGIVVPPRELHIYHMPINRTKEKLEYVREVIFRHKLDAYLLCDPSSVCWVMDVRDLEAAYAPLVLGHLLVTKDDEMAIYLDESYVFDETNVIRSKGRLGDVLKKYHLIGLDPNETPASIQHPNILPIRNPCLLPKALKTTGEMANIKCAALQDSVALINFLHWIYTHQANGVTELAAAEKSLYFRKMQPNFLGESFPCIAAADENSAIVHYSPNKSCHKKIEKILLLDSGGQYKHGTTDITRTICFTEPGEKPRLLYTLVLKGHIALASAKIPAGSGGARLDSLARQFLWGRFLDYNHSTGHGIGYMADVHEGPMALASCNDIPLEHGMVLSNEPGCYLENDFGVRLENMMMVSEVMDGFLMFETISLVPFDMNFMLPQLLTAEEIAWLNRYHQLVLDSVADKLSTETNLWLRSYCHIL